MPGMAIVGFSSGRRREQWAVVILLQDGQRLLAQVRREVDDVVLRDPLPVEGRGLGRKGLRRRRFFARHRRLRNGSLFDGPDRLARHTIEDVDEALLAHQRYGFDGLPVHTDIDQVRGRRRVIVP